MLKTKIFFFRYFAFILTFFLAGCGYDTLFQYKTEASTGHRLTITTDTSQQASSVIKQAFMNEELETILAADFGHLETYYIPHNSSKIDIYLHHDYKLVSITIYPARLNTFSAKGRAELKKREAAILRIKKVLEQTDSFDVYIPHKWECERKPFLPGC